MSISTWFYTNFKQYDFTTFQNCGAWTKIGAVDRFLGNEELHRVMYMQPALFSLFTEAIQTNTVKGYDKLDKMRHIMSEVYWLVGFGCDIVELQNSKDWDLVRNAIIDLLAPDVNDLLQIAEEEDREADGPTDFGLTWDRAFEQVLSGLSGSPILQEQLRESDVKVYDLGDGVYEFKFNLRED